MIHVSETLTVSSVEGFLTPEEVSALTTLMDTALAEGDRQQFDAERTATRHAIPGHTAQQAMAIFEPAGRLEIHQPPQPAAEILATATLRAIPALRRAMPSLTACRDWMYVEYGPGQHITPHVDGIAPDPGAWPRQLAGISVILQHASAGGEFFVETTSSPALWTAIPTPAGYHHPMPLAHEGADHSSPWFRTMPRTRWNVTPEPGTALLYGSQLTHGTEPVQAGRERKFISWLIAGNS